MDTDSLIQALWPHGNDPAQPQVYALLDGARDERIAAAVLQSNLPHACLYAGPLTQALRSAAPYLVQLAPESRFFHMLAASGWGQAWGVFAIAPPAVTLPALRKHFRALLRVKDERGRVLVFRFYDPRVLRLYLPTCTPAETPQIFGGVQSMVCESAEGTLLRYAPTPIYPARPGTGTSSPDSRRCLDGPLRGPAPIA